MAAGAWASAQATWYAISASEGPYKADPPGFGTGITVEADTSVTGNVIENAPRFGIELGLGKFLRNVIANGN